MDYFDKPNRLQTQGTSSGIRLMMNDVTAVVLTIGEATTQRAIKSIESQSLPPCKIIVLEHVTPFYAAMNQAIEKVQTEFFVQVDADMILDNDCLATFRKCMGSHVGVVVGRLRDPLTGRVVGIKMFRKAGFKFVRFKDSISADTDAIKEMAAQGWSQVDALNFSHHKKCEWHTFGEHRPEYMPHYTYSKFLIEGSRYRYRKHVPGLRSELALLQKSEGKVATIALVAMAHGIFWEKKDDGLKPYVQDAEWCRFKNFIESPATYRFLPLTICLSSLCGIPHPFKTFYRLGSRIRQANAFSTFVRVMDVLRKLNIQVAWIPIVALSHGALSQQSGDEDCARAEHVLNEMMAFSVSQWDRQTNQSLFALYYPRLFHFMKKILRQRSHMKR